MRAAVPTIVVAVGLSLLPACTFGAEGNPTGLYAAVLRAVVPLPNEVPPEVQAGREAPERFAPAEEPLQGVVAGTVSDDLRELNGCWARYAEESRAVGNNGEKVREQTIRVYVFDLEAGTYTSHHWLTADRIIAPFSSATILMSVSVPCAAWVIARS